MKVALSAALVALVCAVNSAEGRIRNLVTFGDSYTDIVSVGDGGTAWPVYTAEYAQAQLFPFARSGGTCSNNLTPRPFPSVFESQLPTYFSEINNGALKLDAEETLYTLWIGTNDVGANALLTGTDDASIVDVVECMINWVKVLYQSGARNFLFQNMIPLQNTILYSSNSYPNRFWNTERNTTEWAVFIKELVLSGNKLAELMLQALAPTLKGAQIGLLDSYSLFADMFAHPQIYLNGTVPLNVTGAVNSCVFDLNSSNNTCTVAQGTARDSFLWFDELHPSEQADRVVARQVADVIEGKRNKWVTWLS